MPGLVSFVNRDLTYRFVNARYREWLGRPVEDFEGKPLADVLWPDALEELRPHLERAFAGESVWFDRRLRCVDRIRDVHAVYVPQRNISGEIDGVIALIQDVTEQRRAEEARRESESQFRRIVELASEGMWIVDPEGRTTFANRRLGEMLGYPAEDLMGRHFADFISEEDRGRSLAGFAMRIDGDTRPREYRFRRRDGSPLWLDFTAAPIRDAAGALTGVMAMCTDVTERRLAREQMEQTQKLESLGVLAGGIAHDFNNLLVGMMGNASLAADILPESSPAQPMLAGVIAASERAAKLTQQLLAYAGRETRKVGAVDLDSMIAEIVPLLHAGIPRTVDLNLELAGNLPPVEGDEGQLQQIVMNLVINGAEAVAPGATGSVTVKTELRPPTENEKRHAVIPLPGRPARFVAVSVRDTGCGMDQTTAARIFDPFYTTKFTGRGLGLSAVLGIVRAHSGTLILETAPGKGTNFMVFLPALDRKTEMPGSAEPGSQRGAGTILVVDDEAGVRELATRALEFSGYRVLLACDGPEAVEMVQRHPEIDLVLLDLAMPKMPGDVAAVEIRKLRPGIPLLISTGYGQREAGARFDGIGASGFLRKPYTVRGLVRELRKAMSKP